MKINDIAKAFYMLAVRGNKGKVMKVEDGLIFIKRKKQLQVFTIEKLVKAYDEVYSELD